MDAEGKNRLSVDVLKKFRIVFGAVRQHFNEVEAQCGINGAQLWLLKEVDKTPLIGVSELATRLAIHQSTASQMVEKLVTKRLINKIRSNEDQRRVGLSVSNEAKLLLQNAPSPTEGVLPDALLSLNEATLLTLDQGLQEVINQLKERDERFSNKPLADL